MFIFSNLATSIDGKIATVSRVHFPMGTPEDRRMMQVLRKRADAVLMGATTLRAYKGPLLARGARKQPINVVLSSTLAGISPKWKFFQEKSTERVLFVSSKTPRSRITEFEKTCIVVVLKKDTAAEIVKALKLLGVKRLLVEGGGAVMWDFVRYNLIDEYYVTVVPRVLGGRDAPTMVEGLGFEPAGVVNLKLKRCKRVGDELYLVYSRTARLGR